MRKKCLFFAVKYPAINLLKLAMYEIVKAIVFYVRRLVLLNILYVW